MQNQQLTIIEQSNYGSGEKYVSTRVWVVRNVTGSRPSFTEYCTLISNDNLILSQINSLIFY